jgi:DNA-binding transcriptional ArsR family regulator
MRHQAQGNKWAETVAQAVLYCHRHGLGVLVVDTLDKWAGQRGDAENNAGSVNEVLEPLQQAASAGLVVVIVAHQRKSIGNFGEAVRGSNALTGAVDVVAELERPRSDVLAGEGKRVLRAVSRFTSTPEELVVALTDDGYEARGDMLTAEADAERERVLGVLEQAAVLLTRKQLHEETDLAESTLDRHLKKLEEDELVHKGGAGRRGDPFVYSHHSNLYWDEAARSRASCARR